MGNPDCSCKLTRPVPSASGRRRRRRGSGWVSAGWRRPGRCGVRLLGQYAPALRPLTAAATVPMDSPCCSCKPTPRSGPISGHVSGVTAVGGRRPAAPLRSTPQQHAHTCPAAAPRGKAGFSSSKTLPFAQRDRAQRRRCVPVQVALGGIEESMQQLVAESQVWLTAAVPMENPYCSCKPTPLHTGPADGAEGGAGCGRPGRGRGAGGLGWRRRRGAGALQLQYPY